MPTSDTSQPEFGSGKHTKPDCIIPQRGQCEIWEFKPDSPKGHSEGPEQIGIYRTAVPYYYNELLRTNRDPDDAHGGSTFKRALKDNCYDEDDKGFQFKADVYDYKMCDTP